MNDKTKLDLQVLRIFLLDVVKRAKSLPTTSTKIKYDELTYEIRKLNENVVSTAAIIASSNNQNMIDESIDLLYADISQVRCLVEHCEALVLNKNVDSLYS